TLHHRWIARGRGGVAAHRHRRRPLGHHRSWLEPVEYPLLDRSRARQRHLREEAGVKAERDRGYGGQHRYSGATPQPLAYAKRLFQPGEDASADKERERE